VCSGDGTVTRLQNVTTRSPIMSPTAAWRRDTSQEARIRDLLSAMPGAHLSPSEFPERHLMVIVSNLRVVFP